MVNFTLPFMTNEMISNFKNFTNITNFPFLSSYIPSSSSYCVFISLFMRYTRACSSYECFILRARRHSGKLLKQGYPVERLKSSFKKFYGRYGDIIQHYEVSLSRMKNDILTLDQLQWLPSRSDFPPISWPWYRAWPSPNYEGLPWSICNECGMPAWNAYPSGHLWGRSSSVGRALDRLTGDPSSIPGGGGTFRPHMCISPCPDGV